MAKQRFTSKDLIPSAPALPKPPYHTVRFGQAGVVHLASYNCHNFYDPELKQTEERARKLKTPAELQALADAILTAIPTHGNIDPRGRPPDIIALQEVTSEAVLKQFNQKYLKEKFGVIITQQTNDPRGMRLGLLYRKDLRPTRVVSHHQYRYQDERAFRRGLLEVHFELPIDRQNTGKPQRKQHLIVLCGHFKSMLYRGGPVGNEISMQALQQMSDLERNEAATQWIRLREARAARELVTHLQDAYPRALIVLLGDLNIRQETPYGQQSFQALTGAEGGDTPPVLQDVIAEHQRRSNPSYRYRGNSFRLDYVLATPQTAERVIRAGVRGRVAQEPWRTASDHCPVYASLKLSNRPTLKKGGAPRKEHPPSQSPKTVGQGSLSDDTRAPAVTGGRLFFQA
jgi:endonuclease/exonuclease/phosphatase family metal-dependent hydrolase